MRTRSDHECARRLRTRPKRISLSFILLVVGLSFFCSCTHENDVDLSTSVSPKALEASEELLAWLNERVEMMVLSKANCTQMAYQMVTSSADSRSQLSKWRSLHAGETLAQRAIKDPEFGRQLNQLILRGDLVYSYCAYQSSFRDRLKTLR